jgi:hypothetical protein
MGCFQLWFAVAEQTRSAIQVYLKLGGSGVVWAIFTVGFLLGIAGLAPRAP